MSNPEDLAPQLLRDSAAFAAACFKTLCQEHQVAFNVLVEQGGTVEVAVVVTGAAPRITLVGIVGERRIELGHVELKIAGEGVH